MGPVKRALWLGNRGTPTPTPTPPATVTLADIQAMFGAGDTGGLHVANDTTKLWQDLSGGTTTAVSASNDPVRTWLDVSGKNNHLTTATSAARFLYDPNAGKPRLLNDMAGSLISPAVAGFTNHTRISCIKQIGYKGGEGDIFLNRTGGGSFYLYQNGTSPAIRVESSSTGFSNSDLALNTDGVVIETRTGATAGTLQVNANTPTSGSFGAAGPTGLMVGGTGTFIANYYVYGVMWINRVLTAAEINKCRTYFGSLAGLSL